MSILLLSISIVLLDQASKCLIVSRIPLHGRIPVIPGFFQIVHVHNTGAAWGMLEGFNACLIALSVVILGAMLVFRRSIMGDGTANRIAAALIAGGIVGNLFDRLRLGYVVDFLDFHLGASHFPAFNVADSAICIGAGLYILFQALAPDTEQGADVSAQ